jgi:hypothetical protein
MLLLLIQSRDCFRHGLKIIYFTYVDPDPHGPALNLVGLIRIRICIGNADPDPGGQNQNY